MPAAQIATIKQATTATMTMITIVLTDKLNAA
jgi:hypothetical protein